MINQVFIDRNRAAGTIDLTLCRATHHAVEYATELVWSQSQSVLSPNPSGPTIPLRESEAQQLFNELWAAGFRAEGESTEGQQRAMQKHIDDLRKVAFKTLEISDA